MRGDEGAGDSQSLLDGSGRLGVQNLEGSQDDVLGVGAWTGQENPELHTQSCVLISSLLALVSY